MVVIEHQTLVGFAGQPDAIADLALKLPGVPSRIADSHRRAARPPIGSRQNLENLARRGQHQIAIDDQTLGTCTGIAGVKDESPLRFDRTAHENQFGGRPGTDYDAQAAEEIGDGQPFDRTVDGQTHRVSPIVLAQEDHGSFEPGIPDPWHRHKQEAREMGRGGRRHDREDRDSARPNQPHNNRQPLA